MKTISVRDLRAKSAQVWRDLAREKDLVVTSSGRPVGILSAATEDTLEKSLTAVRRARAMLAVLSQQLESAKEGRDKLTLEAINTEIVAVRKGRRK